MIKIIKPDVATKEMISFIYFFKCRACYLEFSVFSNDNDWNEKFAPFCPECNKRDMTLLCKKGSEKPISSLVYSED